MDDQKWSVSKLKADLNSRRKEDKNSIVLSPPPGRFPRVRKLEELLVLCV